MLKVKRRLENNKQEDIEYLDQNYDDALVVFVRMINALVKRVMIDIGNFIDILYFDAFQKLGLSLIISPL